MAKRALSMLLVSVLLLAIAPAAQGTGCNDRLDYVEVDAPTEAVPIATHTSIEIQTLNCNHQPLGEIDLDIRVTGANTFQSKGKTDENGRFVFEYTSATSGEDSIEVEGSHFSSGPPFLDSAQGSTTARWSYTDPTDDYLFDQRLATVADLHPAFTGFRIDEDSGVVTISVTDLGANLSAIQRDLIRAMEMPQLIEFEPEARRVVFSFIELYAWHDLATREILSLPDAVLTYIDESDGTLVIGLENPAVSTEKVTEILVDLGIPLLAVRITQEEPETAISSLTDTHRPLVGGLQIQRVIDSTYVSNCTLGFIAERNGVVGFVTNTHCSRTKGVVDGTEWGQPITSALVGRETVDPRYWRPSNCPKGRICRHSDSSFAALTSTSLSYARQIARAAEGSPSWDGSSHFYFYDKQTPAKDARIVKVGITTGLTTGQVRDTCVNVREGKTDVVYLCQGRTTYTADNGDSGSAVFSRGTGQARILHGIQWGTRTFSPWGNIRMSTELGPMTVCYTAYGC